MGPYPTIKPILISDQDLHFRRLYYRKCYADIQIIFKELSEKVNDCFKKAQSNPITEDIINSYRIHLTEYKKIFNGFESFVAKEITPYQVSDELRKEIHRFKTGVFRYIIIISNLICKLTELQKSLQYTDQEIVSISNHEVTRIHNDKILKRTTSSLWLARKNMKRTCSLASICNKIVTGRFLQRSRTCTDLPQLIIALPQRSL